MKFTPNEIYCDGCSQNGQIFSWAPKCDIRTCCKDRQLENCAYCEEYACEILKESFDKTQNTKQNLE